MQDGVEDKELKEKKNREETRTTREIEIEIQKREIELRTRVHEDKTRKLNIYSSIYYFPI